MPIIWKGNYRGLSDSKWNGVAESFYRSVGLDGHSSPGILKVHQALKAETGTVPDELCKVAIALSTGYTIWFSADSGKIWARSSGGTGTLAHTTTAGAGENKCLGALEYNGNLYWATQSRLHKIPIANADDSWTGETEDFATFDVTDSDWHPMAIQDLTLFIGDGNQVAEVNTSGTFNSNVLDLKTPFRIKTMVAYGFDLLIGTFVTDTVNRTEVIRWDTVSPSWNTSDPIEEVGINAFIRDDNYMYVNAGRAGNIYFYNEEILESFKTIPGDYSSTKYGTINPNSVANFKGKPIFGFSNGAGNPALQGIYMLASYSRDYPKVLDLPWVVSPDVTSNVEIGAIIVADFDLLVSWKEGNNYGVDALDTTAKYTGAYFETRMIRQSKRNILKTLEAVSVFYNSLPTNTNFVISYSVNGGAYQSMVNDTVKDAIIQAVKAELRVDSIGSLQLKVQFTVSGNNGPTMEMLEAILEE